MKRDIPYSGYFARGNIFVKVVILAISWNKFRGFGRAHAVRDAVCAFSCANISWFASRPRKPRKYYPSKNTRYTVITHSIFIGNIFMHDLKKVYIILYNNYFFKLSVFQMMRGKGNRDAKMKWEVDIPVCWVKPWPHQCP